MADIKQVQAELAARGFHDYRWGMPRTTEYEVEKCGDDVGVIADRIIAQVRSEAAYLAAHPKTAAIRAAAEENAAILRGINERAKER